MIFSIIITQEIICNNNVRCVATTVPMLGRIVLVVAVEIGCKNAAPFHRPSVRIVESSRPAFAAAGAAPM